MIAGTWLAFASALFAVIALGCSFFISRLTPVGLDDPVYWHADLARGVSMMARDGFAALACIALLWHLIVA